MSRNRFGRKSSQASTRQLRVEYLENRRVLACSAGAINVPADQPTIQAGLDAAAANAGADEVCVAQGTYTESPTINDADPVTLKGATGNPNHVRINGAGGGDILTVLSDDVTVEDIRLYNGGDDGIQGTGVDNFTVNNVYIIGIGNDGLDVDNSSAPGGNVTVNGGIFRNTASDGVVFDDSVGTLIIDGLDVRNNADDGVDIVDANFVEIKNTLVLGNGQDGIEVDEVITIELTNITSKFNDDDGLDIDEAGLVIIEDGWYLNNGGDGIEIDDAEVVYVTDVDSRNNDLNGLNVDMTEILFVSGGFYNGNGRGKIDELDAGMDLDAVEAITIDGAVANSNRGDGIDINNAVTVEITDTRALFNGNGNPEEDGLDIEVADQVIVTAGTYSKNAENGIEINDVGNLSLVGVTAERNGDDGLDISAAIDLVIEDGRYKHNSDDGIELDDIVAAILQDVQAKNNVDDGLYVHDFNGPVLDLDILGGDYSSNGTDGIKTEGAPDVFLGGGAIVTANGDDGLDVTQLAGVVVIQAGSEPFGNTDANFELNGALIF